MADLVQKFSSWSSTPGLHVFISLTNALNSFLRVSALPFEIRAQSLIERLDCVLAMTLGVIIELRLPFRVDGDQFHTTSVGSGTVGVNGNAS